MGEQIFGTIFNAAAGQGMGYLNSLLTNNIAKEQMDYGLQQNYYYNEQAAKSADVRTRNLYNDLYSPKAQIEQIKAAGLSPSIYASGGLAGISGQSGAQGNGGAGISPTTFGIQPVDLADIQLKESIARKNNAEADEIQGENEMGKAKIANILADAGYKEAATKVQNATEAGLDLQNYITSATLEPTIYGIQQKARRAGLEAEIAYEECEQSKLLTEINRQTLEAEVLRRQLVVDEMVQNIAESKSRVKLNDQQITTLKAQTKKLLNDVTLGWQELKVEQRKTQGYIDFIYERTRLMSQELKATLKDLDLKEQRMYIDTFTETIKSIAIGAMAVAQFKGGNPTTGGTPPSVKGVGGKWNKGGNAVNHNQYNEGNDVWYW